MPLLPEDGAVFEGHIESIEGKIRASYSVKLDKLYEVQIGEPVYGIFDMEEDARKWLHSEANKRGFKTLAIRK